MADVQGLLSDPQFQGLDPASQKQVLGRIDSQFSGLSDQEFSDFKSRVAAPKKGLIDRAKDYFTGLPSIMNIIPPEGVERSDGSRLFINDQSTPTKFAQAGFMGPRTSVPGSVAEATGKKVLSKPAKFFGKIGDEAAQLRGEAPAEPVAAPSAAAPASATAEEISTAKNLGGKLESMTPAPVKAPDVSMAHYEQTGQSFGTRMIQHATGKDAAIIEHLQTNGLTPEQFEAMPTPVKNDWIAKVNSATGKKFEYYRGAQGANSITRLLKTWRYLTGPAAGQ